MEAKGVINAVRPPEGSPAETRSFRLQICYCSFLEPRSDQKGQRKAEKLILFTNSSARAGYDTRSIFKQSLTGLNSEFSFS